jgi:hypothetical protein
VYQADSATMNTAMSTPEASPMEIVEPSEIGAENRSGANAIVSM